MTHHSSSRFLRRKLAKSLSLCTVLGAALCFALPGHAATLTWNAGTGTWDTTTANWTGATWADGSDAVFGTGTPGIVTISQTANFPTYGLGSPAADGLDFTQAGYTIGNAADDGTIYVGAGTNNPGTAGMGIYLGYTGISGSAASSTTTINSDIVVTAITTGKYVIDLAKNYEDLNVYGTINEGSNAVAMYTSSGNINLFGVISGSGALALNGVNTTASAYVLDGLNTFTGAATVVNANVTINTLANAGQAQSFGENTTAVTNDGNGYIAFNGAGQIITLDLATDSSTDRQFNIARTATISSQGAGVVNFTGSATTTNGAIFNNNYSGFITLDADNGTVSDANTVSGTLVGSSTHPLFLNETGTGVWAFTGANSYTGATDINGGTLMVSTLNSYTGTAALLAKSSLGAPIKIGTATIGLGTAGVSAPGTLYDTGTGETSNRNFSLVGNGVIDQEGTGALKLTGNITGILNPTSTTHQITLQGSSSGTGEVSGVISDAPSGTTTVTSEITVSGTSAVGSKSISVDNAADLFTVGATVSGADFAAGTTVTAVSQNSVTLSTGITTATSNGDVVTVSGGGGGATSVVKDGTGTWTLSGANTYTGSTTVSKGTLNVTGSIASSASTVASGATMTGTGTTGAIGVSGNLTGTLTSGDLTVNSGGLIAPGFGLATGTMSATSLTFNANGTLAFVLDGTGLSSSNLSLTGAFTLVPGTGNYDVNLTDTSALAAGTYDLVNFGSTDALSASQFTQTGSLTYDSGLSGSLALNGNQLDFVVAAVPEPDAWASLLLGLGVLGVVLRYRSSFRRSI